jgi:hypothetical protein
MLHDLWLRETYIVLQKLIRLNTKAMGRMGFRMWKFEYEFPSSTEQFLFSLVPASSKSWTESRTSGVRYDDMYCMIRRQEG